MAGAFYSCTSMGKIAIQISVPPKYHISSEIRTIAILNRSINTDFMNFRNDSAENLLKNVKSLQNYRDSSASDSAVVIAARALFDSQRFDVVVPLQRNMRRIDNLSKLPPIDTTTIEQIREDFKVDAVLVLESFSEKISASFDLPWRRVIGQLDLTYDASWNLYQPGQQPPVLSLKSHDVLTWIGGLDKSHKEGMPQLPSIKDVLLTGGIESALDLAENISPIWINETRYYFFTGDKNIDAAIPLIKLNKWDEAAQIWKKYLSVSSKAVLSKIEYNLALTEEMNGDIDQAIEWATKSFRTMFSVPAENYLKYLAKRRLELDKL